MSDTPGSTTEAAAATGPQLLIRTAVPADGPALAALDHRCWSTLSDVSERSDPPGPTSTPFDERHLPEDYQLALLDEVLVGYVRLVPPTPLPSNTHVRMIQGLAVDDSARGRGIGRALVEAAVERARGLGARRVTLRVLGPNAPARRLYESLGFVVEGLAPEEFLIAGRYVDDVSMGLTLHRES